MIHTFSVFAIYNKITEDKYLENMNDMQTAETEQSFCNIKYILMIIYTYDYLYIYMIPKLRNRSTITVN